MTSAHKVMILGEIGVGKSSLAQRLMFNRFSGEYKPTIGVEVYRYDVPVETTGAPMALILWDTDGNFGDAIFAHVYLKEAAAAIIVADPTRPATLDAAVNLADGFAAARPGRAVHLIVNKWDMITAANEPVLPPAFRSRPMTKTSALSGACVVEAFGDVARAIRRRGH